MEKIRNIFGRSGRWLKSLGKPLNKIWLPIKARIFWKKEEARRKKIMMIIAWAFIIALLALAAYVSVLKVLNNAKSAATTYPTVTAKAIILTSNKCDKKCWDSQLFLTALQNKGVKIEKVETATVDPLIPIGGGAALAKKYEITKVPTVILEFTGDNKPDLTQFFSASLGKVYDNKFVLSKILAPYYDMTAKKIKGIVNVTYLGDQSCKECYDAKLHETALKNLGVDTTNAKSVDASSEEGKALISKYAITKLPTVIVTGEVAEYSALVEMWPQVGVIATDGAYIFTNEDLMGSSYRDLKTGKIVKAKAAATK